ncbi:MAG: 3-dehydroquinate synthase [Deltaproteobacteria bacterium]|nr:3-dehydroquinate synthase [Deltaproteobacteria bacterium]
MKTLSVKGNRIISKIHVGERLQHADRYMPVEKSVIVTDRNVRELYHTLFPSCPVIEIGMGEKIKTLDTVRSIYDGFLSLEVDRSGFILGIGGGIVCDVTGFAASTYMRGIPFGFVSTTLLSQVDASVGGKNGVNFNGYKNMVGLFNQPDFVLCDMALLKTLPEKELCGGLAEVVKHAAIGDEALFSYIEENDVKALQLDGSVLEKFVYDSVRIKSAIVSADEREMGERRKLNFGHTFGHAIEKVTGWPHGEAVSLGMMIAAKFSMRKGFLRKQDVRRLENVLESLKLPTRGTIDREALKNALGKDKKRKRDKIHFVFLDGIGQARVEATPITEVTETLDEIMK